MFMLKVTDQSYSYKDMISSIQRSTKRAHNA